MGQQMHFIESNGMISYDKYIVLFSGGKDSTACFLHLLDIGIPISKMELWHHDVDGKGESFMDWEVTPDYCRKFAKSFGVPIYFSWKEGGFKREMLRDKQKTAPVYFECPDGSTKKNNGGINGTLGTRLMFPQVSADLNERWCSPYLKIDVGTSAICNQKRFNNQNVLVVSGERGEESAARSKYADFEIDRSDNRFVGTYLIQFKRKTKGVLKTFTRKVTKGKANRRVDRWRPVKNWAEQHVWAIIEKYKIRVHPCYYLGFSRCSCLFCIFGNADQFASAILINPIGGEKIMGYEDSFGVTIKRKISIRDLHRLGTPYPSITKELADLAMSTTYDLQIIMNNEEWVMPAGAFGEGCGPT